MRINKFFVLKVWLISTFLIAFICACAPNIRTYPFSAGHTSFLFRLGMFVGVFETALTFSVPIFLCLYGLFFLLTARLFMSEIIVKSALAVLLLIGVFICNSIYFPAERLQPFFIAYVVETVSAIFFFRIYQVDLDYID